MSCALPGAPVSRTRSKLQAPPRRMRRRYSVVRPPNQARCTAPGLASMARNERIPAPPGSLTGVTSVSKASRPVAPS